MGGRTLERVPDFEVGVYLRTLFGLQLVEYLLFALLVLVLHVIVNQKYVGHLVALLAYGVMVDPHALGIEHRLLVYGSSPRWTYSDRRCRLRSTSIER
jgi:ABC-2 type transport system permease protein